MRRLIRRIFEKASFHGFAYIPHICWNQWERYKVNPTVFSVERVFGTREFPYMGVTMCSNYFDEERAKIIIQNNWNASAKDDKFSYYMQFLRTLTTIKYNNLEELQPYTNDSTLNEAHFLKFLWDIRSTLYMNVTGSEGSTDQLAGTVRYGFEGDKEPRLHGVITEVGMCETTSLLHEYQNPTGFQRDPNLTAFRKMCSPFSECVLKVTPSVRDGDRADAYIHNIKDIVPHDEKFVIHREMTQNGKTDVDVDLKLSSAEAQVRDVPIEYRKCRFHDENILKYFKTYRPPLCRIECRINAALRLCNCKPFFYVVGKGPVCSIEGMQCLARANWKNSVCSECVSLCAFLQYTALKANQYNYSKAKFETTLTVKMVLPSLGNRRIVVFSFDRLVVAFGGAASLFLGCSFISFAQIIFYCIQSFTEQISRWFSKKK